VLIDLPPEKQALLDRLLSLLTPIPGVQALARVASFMTQALFALNETYFMSDKTALQGNYPFVYLFLLTCAHPVLYCRLHRA
jgi:hypothetical protein